jgi:hypothetical protein
VWIRLASCTLFQIRRRSDEPLGPGDVDDSKDVSSMRTSMRKREGGRSARMSMKYIRSRTSTS